MITTRCKEQHIRLIKKISRDIPEIEVNKSKLQEALLNFASNSIDAMPDGGTLTLSCNTDKRHIFIEIKDTGIGIPPEDMDKIFEPFFTKKDCGTGLGVGLASNIIVAHKGDLKILSTVGEGTEIFITLPIKIK